MAYLSLLLLLLNDHDLSEDYSAQTSITLEMVVSKTSTAITPLATGGRSRPQLLHVSEDAKVLSQYLGERGRLWVFDAIYNTGSRLSLARYGC